MTGITFQAKANPQLYTIEIQNFNAMLTLLLATDFSANSKAAARYGYQLAMQTKANVVLCNAVIVPAEVPQADMALWPADEFDLLIHDSEEVLKDFIKELEALAPTDGFKPKITCITEPGLVTDVLASTAAKHHADIIITGTHSGGNLSRFLVGDHASQLIENSQVPVLIVPANPSLQPIRKIAFATELVNMERDLKPICDLITWGKLLNAEIIITHIADEKYEAFKFQKDLAESLLSLADKSHFPDIHYRMIKDNKVEDGLEWLSEHGQLDMLAMVHQHRNLFAELFGHSHTKKMAANLQLPLMVFPALTH
jgi:nucleotide-binding universal stress UspA family protein